MNGEMVSGAIAGGLSGLYGDFREQRRLQQQEELANLRGQISQMIAQLNAGSRERVAANHDETAVTNTNTRADASKAVAGTNATSRENVAATNAGSRERVASANNDASLDRLNRQIKFGEYKWKNPSANATLSSETTRRGQDVSATTTRRGQDIGSETARRGQDLSFNLGSERNALTERDQDIDFGLGTERNANTRGRRSIFDVTFGAPNQPAAAPAPASPVMAPPPAAAPAPKLPPSVVRQRPAGGAPAARGTVPVTPRATPATAPAAAPKADTKALSARAEALLREIDTAKDPARQAAIRKELADIRKQILAARGQ
jgi:hypothetical protein